MHDQSRCRSAKDQYASEEAHAITTTRLPVVIVYVRQSIIWQGTWLGSAMKKSLVTRLDGVSACTVLRPEYKTHKQKDANSFVFVIEDKLRGRSLDNCIY